MSDKIETTLDESSVTAGAKPADPKVNCLMKAVDLVVSLTSVVLPPKL